MTAVAGRVNPMEHGIMTIMTTNRSSEGGTHGLAAGLLVAALFGSVACVPATAVADAPDSAAKTPAAAQPDAAVLLERARKKIKVDHDVAGAVEAYREVIEKHRADLAHARPALRELLDLWAEVQGNEAAAAAIRPAAEKYLDMPRPIDPKAASARSDDDLTRDLLLKPWLVTLKFDKAPLKDVLAEITRQSGVAIEVGTAFEPFDAAKYRDFMNNLPRNAELPEEDRKALQEELLAMMPGLEDGVEDGVEDGGDPDEMLPALEAQLAGVTTEMLGKNMEDISQQQEAATKLAQSEVTIEINDVTALAAIDAVGAAVPTPLVVRGGIASVRVYPSSHAPSANTSYQGRSSMQLTSQRTTHVVGEVRQSRLTISVHLAQEPGLSLQGIHVRSVVGTDSRGRKFAMQEQPEPTLARTLMDFSDVPAEIQEFVTLTGELTATVLAEKQAHHLPLTKGNRVETPQGTFTVESIDKAGGQTVVTLAASLKHTSELDMHAAVALAGLGIGPGGVDGELDLVLELANGKRIRAHGMSMHGDGTKSEMKLEFATRSAEPTTLIWTVPTKEIPVTIPFEFKNVKLP